MAEDRSGVIWSSRRQVSLVMQSEAAECALACIAMVSRYHGHNVDLASLRRRFSGSLKGINLSRMIEIAQELGFDSRPLRAELGYLPEAEMPCIAHWNLNHFVVISKVKKNLVHIFDPAKGFYKLTLQESSKHFTGVLLELSEAPNFSPISDAQKISWRSLTGRVTGFTKVILQVFCLALGIEALTLVMPFQLQWVIDKVLLSADKNLLLTMTLGFSVAIMIQTGLTLARAWLITWFGASLNAQWTINLFSHLMRLPLDYFEKRHIGDVVSRFSSIQSIQSTLTGTFVEGILDGLMGTFALCILFIYSPLLTVYVLTAFVVYAALRIGFYRKQWRINEEQLIYTAKQQTELMESVRGIQAIKLASKLGERKSRLANATIEAARMSMQSQRIILSFGAINQFLFGTSRILLIAFGALMAINGNFTAGMVVAYIAYADQFASKFGSLIDKFVDLKMLKLHAGRISDISSSAPEKDVSVVFSGPEPEPNIQIINLGFRYSDGDPWIFRNLNLSIKSGESLSITGASGCGKSTLTKLLLGLLEPTEGLINIDGLNITRFGLNNYRRIIGTVMQEDTLFAGSIADNISFFDPEAVFKDVIEAATVAQIHREIMEMTMGYESLVGDMGSSLSGGQKQRILLARALYRKPKLLVLDEATSHLDLANETLINDGIRNMDITRIVVAHRENIVKSTDRQFDLEKYSLSENLAIRIAITAG